MTEPCDLTALQARRLIGNRALSPVELAQSCIARIEAVDHAVNAMPARDFDRALASAKTAEAAVMSGAHLGVLHGLPVGIKDLEETEGLRTTWGSPIFANHVPKADCGMVTRLKTAGAIVLGKTNVPEFGAGANTRNTVYGATGNAFDPTRSAAGSSGGSAVALATGMVPIASGSDTGGSLRNPAAFNGIVGFRPSPGLVPSETRGFGWSPLPVLGPMARNMPDLCLMMAGMVGDDARDPLAYTLPHRTVRGEGALFHPPRAIDLGTFRVAFTEDFGFAPTEKLVRRAFSARAKAIAPWFGQAVEAHPDCSGTDRAFEVLRALSMVSSHGAKVRERPQDVGPNIIANVKEGLSYGVEDVAQALASQTQIYRRWQRFFDDHDVIISPAITISPRPWRELFPAEIDGVATRTYFHWLALAYAATTVGHPAISIPLGVDELGMPFGLQVVGPRGGDALVLAVAAAIEAQAAGMELLARPVPDIAALTKAGPISAMAEFKTFA